MAGHAGAENRIVIGHWDTRCEGADAITGLCLGAYHIYCSMPRALRVTIKLYDGGLPALDQRDIALRDRNIDYSRRQVEDLGKGRASFEMFPCGVL